MLLLRLLAAFWVCVAQAAWESDSYEYLVFRENNMVDGMSRLLLKGGSTIEVDQNTVTLPDDFRLLTLLNDPRAMSALRFLGNPYPRSGGGFSDGRRFTYSYELGSPLPKSGLQLIFIVPMPRSLRVLSAPPSDIASIGRFNGPYASHRKLVLVHIQLAQTAPGNCEVDSRWIRASRSYFRKESGLIIEDRVEAKVAEVSPAEAASPEFKALQNEIGHCFAEAPIEFRYSPPKVNADFIHNELIEEKGDLGKLAIAKFNEGGNERGFSKRQFAKMLLHEAISADPEKAKNWGRLALITRNMGYQHEHTFDPNYVAEAKQYANKALNIDSTEYNANMTLAEISLDEENFSQAESRLPAMKKSNSQNAAEFEFYLTIQKAVRGDESDAEMAKAIELLVKRIKSRRPGARSVSFYQDLAILYWRLKRFDYAESSYRSAIKEAVLPAWPLVNFANFLNEMQRYEEAEKYARLSLAAADIGMAHAKLAEALEGQAMAMLMGKDNPNGKADRSPDQLCKEALEHDGRMAGCRTLLDQSRQAQTIEHDLRMKRADQMLKQLDAQIAGIQDSSRQSLPKEIRESILAGMKARREKLVKEMQAAGGTSASGIK